MTESADAANRGSNPSSPNTGETPRSTTDGSTDQPRATDGRFEPKEWRYPADYHVSWMRGKTADEVAKVSDQLYYQLRNAGFYGEQTQPSGGGYEAQPRPRAQQPYQQPQPQQPQGLGPPTQDDWLNDPSAAAAKDWQYRMQTQIQPAMNQYASVIGQQARALAEMKDPEPFQRWGPEIDMMLQNLDPQARTVENIGRVIEMVRGKHVDELANEKAEQRYREMLERGGPETFRPDGTSLGPTSTSAGGRVDLERAELPNAYRRLLARHNVTPDVLDEFLMKTEVEKRGISLREAREEWLKKAQAGDIITEERLHIGNEGGVF